MARVGSYARAHLNAFVNQATSPESVRRIKQVGRIMQTTAMQPIHEVEKETGISSDPYLRFVRQSISLGATSSMGVANFAYRKDMQRSLGQGRLYEGSNVFQRTKNRVTGAGRIETKVGDRAQRALNMNYYNISQNFVDNYKNIAPNGTRTSAYKKHISKQKNDGIFFHVWNDKTQSMETAANWTAKNRDAFDKHLSNLNEKDSRISLGKENRLKAKIDSYMKKQMGMRNGFYQTSLNSLKAKRADLIKQLSTEERHMTTLLDIQKKGGRTGAAKDKIDKAIEKKSAIIEKLKNDISVVETGIKIKQNTAPGKNFKGTGLKNFARSFSRFIQSTITTEEMNAMRQMSNYGRMIHKGVTAYIRTIMLSGKAAFQAGKLAGKIYIKMNLPGHAQVQKAGNAVHNALEWKNKTKKRINNLPKKAKQDIKNGAKKLGKKGVKAVGRQFMKVPGVNKLANVRKPLGSVGKRITNIMSKAAKFITAPLQVLNVIKQFLMKIALYIAVAFLLIWVLLFLVVIIIAAIMSFLNWILGGGDTISLQDVATQIIAKADEVRIQKEESYKNNFNEIFTDSVVTGINGEKLEPDNVNITYWTPITFNNKDRKKNGTIDVKNTVGIRQINDDDLVTIGNYKTILVSADAYFSGNFNFNEGFLDWLQGNTNILDEYVSDRYNDSHEPYVVKSSTNIVYNDDKCASYDYKCNSITTEESALFNKITKTGQKIHITNVTKGDYLPNNTSKSGTFSDKNLRGCIADNHDLTKGFKGCNTKIYFSFADNYGSYLPGGYYEPKGKKVTSVTLTYNVSNHRWAYKRKDGTTGYLHLTYKLPAYTDGTSEIVGLKPNDVGSNTLNLRVVSSRNQTVALGKIRLKKCLCRHCDGHNVTYCNGHQKDADIRILVKSMDKKSIYNNKYKHSLYNTDAQGYMVNYFKSDQSSNNPDAFKKYNKQGLKYFNWMDSSAENNYEFAIERYNVDWMKEYGIEAVLTTSEQQAQREAVKEIGNKLVKDIKKYKGKSITQKQLVAIFKRYDITKFTTKTVLSNLKEIEKLGYSKTTNPTVGDYYIKVDSSGAEYGICGDREMIQIYKTTTGINAGIDDKVTVKKVASYPDEYTYYRIIEVEIEISDSYLAEGAVYAKDGFVWPFVGNYKKSDTYHNGTQVHNATESPMCGGLSAHEIGHCGVDYGCPSGTAVVAIHDGVVYQTGYNDSRGKYIYLKINYKGKPYIVCYQHLSSYSVGAGVAVSAGDLIGRTGNSGVGTGPHLHMEISNNSDFSGWPNNRINPESLYGTSPSSKKVEATIIAASSTNEKKQAITIWKALSKKGFSDYAIAGFLGNCYQESGWQPGAVQSNGIGHGLIQWSYTRWSGPNGLQAYAKKKGRPWNDLGLQLEFFIFESDFMHNGYTTAHSFNEWKTKSSSVETATRDFYYGAERPGPSDDSLDFRIAKAKEVYQLAKKKGLLHSQQK